MATFRKPKKKNFTIMSNHHLQNRKLSLKAKGLLSLILSLPETWNYSVSGLVHISKESESAINSTIRELEEHRYLIRHRRRNEQGHFIGIEYSIHEEPYAVCDSDDNDTEPPRQDNDSCDDGQGSQNAENSEKPNGDYPQAGKCPPGENNLKSGLLAGDKGVQPYCDHPQVENPQMDKPQVGYPKLDYPNVENRGQLNTNRLNTKSAANTNPSNPYQSMDRDEMWMDVDGCKRQIQEQIEYDLLVQEYERERIDELVEIMVEIHCAERECYSISGSKYPAGFVRQRFALLRFSHIQYVMNCLTQNSTKIHNIKAYLVAVLFQAPTTMDNFYTAEVNHDMGTMAFVM